MKTPPQTFTVFRNGEFWMYARGKSAKQMKRAIWWRNNGKVSKDDIKVELTPTRTDGKPLFTHLQKL
jgi:hypothetical protein